MGEYYQRDWGQHPPALSPDYKTSVARSPNAALLSLPQGLGEITGPCFGAGDAGPEDRDLIHNHARPGESAIGERIVLYGRVMDGDGRPLPRTLIEIWQANAGGRYRHRNDGYLAPLDPNFGGTGRTLTDEAGHYAFHTVKPGAYPWRNWANTWRPAHIHLSIFGAGFAQRLITQCYFEGDPLIAHCPIVHTVADEKARAALVAALDLNATIPFDSIAYRFDIVLRGRRSTPFENRQEGA